MRNRFVPDLPSDLAISFPSGSSLLIKLDRFSSPKLYSDFGIARRKGMKLFASGKGLCVVDEKDNITKIITTDENEILSILLGYIPEPTTRN